MADMKGREAIYQSIRADITLGILRPMQRITEEKLATQYGVSRTPIREVIRQLQSEGFLTVEGRKGATVSNLTVNEVEEIYSLRILLEKHSVELFTGNMTEAQEKEIIAFRNAFVDRLRDGNYRLWLEAGIAFHNYFADNCGNVTLARIINDLRARVHRYQYIVTSNSHSLTQHTQEHLNIIDSILKKDPVKAGEFMQLHLGSVLSSLRHYLKTIPAL